MSILPPNTISLVMSKSLGYHGLVDKKKFNKPEIVFLVFLIACEHGK